MKHLNTNFNTLPLPDFISDEKISNGAQQWNYSHNISTLFAAATQWAEKMNIVPAASQQFDFRLLGIDMQRDFAAPGGSLFVAGRDGQGAIDDTIRITRFIYQNLNIIKKIKLTQDTHFLFQIFFAPFWINREGNPLEEHTLIQVGKDGNTLVNTDPVGNLLHEDVTPNPAMAPWLCNGNYAWLKKQVLFYCKELAQKGKYTLYLWPPHCLQGSEGHNIVGVLQEAVLFHNLCRTAEPQYEIKGGNYLTENYDPAAVEVAERWDGKGLIAQKRNPRFFKDLEEADAMVIFGEAASHCVMSMIDGLLNEVLAKNKALVEKLYIMTDCMSAVTVRDASGNMVVDFTDEAQAAFKRFADAGMHLVKSTDPVDQWPNIKNVTI